MGETTFVIEDFSDITPVETEVDRTDRPHMFFAFSSDKGPEKYMAEIRKDKFYKLYGRKPQFRKHGQPLLAAASCVESGGVAMTKRVVAENSRLANFGLAVRVTKDMVPDLDETGAIQYYDASGDITTNSALADPTLADPIVRKQVAQLEWIPMSLSLVGNSVQSMANAFATYVQSMNTVWPVPVGEDGIYPVAFIADNGRGESAKRIVITTDSSQSRPLDYVKYILTVKEDGSELEHVAFTMNPDIIESDRNLSLETSINKYAIQIRGKVFDDSVDQFIENAAYLANIDPNEFKYADLMYGTDLNGLAYETITFGPDNVRFDETGVPLSNGDNGDFGSYPIDSPSYESRLLKAFDSSDDESLDEIYDINNYRIDAIFDQNYPAPVKRAIEDLAEFRQDFMYFRDMGLGLTSIYMIDTANKDNLKSKFCATYHNSWDVEDPFTRKQITVTCTYSLVDRFVNFYLNGVARPFAGIPHKIKWDSTEVFEGTVNFNPKKIPGDDQIKWFKENRINYVVYYNGVLSMESEFTSQTRYSQLSFINNMLNLQSIIREVRAFCPLNRYKFIRTKDLKDYQQDVQKILDKHSADYQTLKLVYAKDTNYENNKIYYAYIYVRFYDFIQDEFFRIAVLKTLGSDAGESALNEVMAL